MTWFREHRLELLLLAALLGLVLVSCSSLPDVQPPSDPWPVKADGTPYARCESEQTSCCATEGPIVNDPWPRQTWTIYSCPEPVPPPTPTPTPAPTPSPEPTPTPAPEPTPTPGPPSECETRFEDYVTTCKWDCDTKREPFDGEEPFGFGQALHESIAYVIANSPDLIRVRNTIDAENETEFTARVSERIRETTDFCAKGRPHDAETAEEADHLSPDEVAIWNDWCVIQQDGLPTDIGACRAHFDVCVATGAPEGRCFVGENLRNHVLLGRKN